METDIIEKILLESYYIQKELLEYLELEKQADLVQARSYE